MSDALSYLVKARPQAMSHYLAFMKDAGSRLDPKTRNLISVITKVHAQTERGLQQYLKRALREGCTPAEIIDALLMAFPALGLSKIVWAVDVILAMGLPGFDPQDLGLSIDSERAPRNEPQTAPQTELQTECWHDLPGAQEVPLGSVRRIESDGHAVFAHRDATGVRVYDSRCPHEGTVMPEQAMVGDRLECSKHRWRFDLATGACIEKGDRPLRVLVTREFGGLLQGRW